MITIFFGTDAIFICRVSTGTSDPTTSDTPFMENRKFIYYST